MIYFCVYDVFFFIFILFFFPYIWKRIKPDKIFPFGWKERFGIYDIDVIRKLRKKKNIWFQTVSVGELLSITPLIRIMREKFPDENIILTVTTKTGRKIALKEFPDIPCLFFPFDFSVIVKRAIKFLNPKLIILVETEIWPNLFRISFNKKIPFLIINGRVSPKSFSRYKKFKFFIKKVVSLPDEIIMRTKEESKRIIYLGAKKEKVTVLGSIKFDQAFLLSEKINPNKIRQMYSIPENKKIVVFGSIHPGEEKPIVEIAKKMLKTNSDITIVIVPRFLDKTNIFKILNEEKIPYAKKSNLEGNQNLPVWVIDTYGELNNFYSICDIAFVGGSLIPWGGQNPIEPAAFKKPVIFGKYNWHFFEEWEKIKNNKGGIEVNDFQQLYQKISFLLDNPSFAREIGEKAFTTILENKDTTIKILSIIKKYF